MKFCLRILTLLLLITGTLSQDLGFDLSDALDDPQPTKKPKEEPKAPEKPKPDGGFSLDLGDAVDPDPIPDKPSGGGSDPKPDKPANKPPKTGGGGGDGFDLGDALGPDLDPEPKKPVKPPQSGGGGGGSFDDSDLFDAAGGNYKPDGGNSGNHDPHGGAGADQPQDPDLLWGQILKMLNANMPEEFYAWLSNLKRTLEPLLERALDLLHAAP
ncbi:CD99 molecule isoform X4 [Nelusetta ayraudi]|uniref:CD99 molecule isoform X4 n=1 Tax=Nelusetta ayraudi TaxID=303726 RepID=UPI003F72AB96